MAPGALRPALLLPGGCPGTAAACAADIPADGAAACAARVVCGTRTASRCAHAVTHAAHATFSAGAAATAVKAAPVHTPPRNAGPLEEAAAVPFRGPGIGTAVPPPPESVSGSRAPFCWNWKSCLDAGETIVQWVSWDSGRWRMTIDVGAPGEDDAKAAEIAGAWLAVEQQRVHVPATPPRIHVRHARAVSRGQCGEGEAHPRAVFIYKYTPVSPPPALQPAARSCPRIR